MPLFLTSSMRLFLIMNRIIVRYLVKSFKFVYFQCLNDSSMDLYV